jgi:hypothetical protein
MFLIRITDIVAADNIWPRTRMRWNVWAWRCAAVGINFLIAAGVSAFHDHVSFSDNLFLHVRLDVDK